MGSAREKCGRTVGYEDRHVLQGPLRHRVRLIYREHPGTTEELRSEMACVIGGGVVDALILVQQKAWPDPHNAAHNAINAKSCVARQGDWIDRALGTRWGRVTRWNSFRSFTRPYQPRCR